MQTFTEYIDTKQQAIDEVKTEDRSKKIGSLLKAFLGILKPSKQEIELIIKGLRRYRG